MRSRLLAVPVSALALLLFAAVPALAQASVTLHEGAAAGPALPAGAPLNGFSAGLTFETAAGNIECQENEVGGEVTANGGPSAEAEITEGRFEAAGGGLCPTALAGGAVKAQILPTGLPWFITFFKEGAEGRNLIVGSPKVDFRVVLSIEGVPVANCDYERAAVWSRFAFNVALGDEIPAQTFTLNVAESAGECPEEGTLVGEGENGFAITSGGEAVVATTP